MAKVGWKGQKKYTPQSNHEERAAQSVPDIFKHGKRVHTPDMKAKDAPRPLPKQPPHEKLY